MDIIVHTAIGIGEWVLSLWEVWNMEILLGASFVMQLVLSLLAGFRWRGATGSLRRVIWLAYVGADYVATTALGNLSISGSSGERQLVAFWAPFFLLHLGGPDNITAYQFEDNQLSMRAVLTLAVQVGGTLFVVYSSITGSWALVVAAWLMVLVCVTKYVERTLALQRANLDNIRSSLRRTSRRGRRRRNLGLAASGGTDGDLLLRAHYLFHICKHAMVDSLVENELDRDERAQTRHDLFQVQHFHLVETMEVELSLMYDFLYTKASVMFTWHGYGIRAVSPLAALGTLLLVELSNHERRHKLSDVVITRVLLVATFTLETVSLLRTLASSWTGFLICSSPRPPSWVRHQALCARWWHRLRRALASVGLIGEERQYRFWNGSIGQLNLYDCLTSGPPMAKEQVSSWSGNQVQIQDKEKTVLYRKLRHKVGAFREDLKKFGADKAGEKMKFANELSTDRGHNTLQLHGLYELLEHTLGSELHVGILTWHIGTDIFLNVCNVEEPSTEEAPVDVQKHAIRTLSNYMMHLLVERPHMLPDMVNRRHVLEQGRSELTQVGTDLTRIWKTPPTEGSDDSNSKENNSYLDDGIELCRFLIENQGRRDFKDRDGRAESILGVILQVWVDMLFYASYRCSKESHAKQLAHGGELTTIVWLLAEHAGLFIVPKSGKKQRRQTSGNTESHNGTVNTNSKPTTYSNIQTPEPATHNRTPSWSGGGDVMIQLHPPGFNSDAYYDLHTHDYFQQNYL